MTRKLVPVTGGHTVDILCYSERASGSQVDNNVRRVPLVIAECGLLCF